MLATRMRMRRVTGVDFYPYKINQSCRFNDNDSAYLKWTNITTADASNTKKTINIWIKRCNLGTLQTILSSYQSSSTSSELTFDASNRLQLWSEYNNVLEIHKASTAVFRDPTAWINIHIEMDTTLVTAEDRIKIYINNERLTSFGTNTNPSQNHYVWMTGHSLSTFYIYLGCLTASGQWSDNYKSTPYYIDGQALTPTSFGQEKYGIWIPKSYTGSYGTNGFNLDFANSADLGNDVSGNNNDFTSSGLATNDKVLDSPTNNYPTLNVIHHLASATLSNGNLQATGAENEYATIVIPPTGKWGWKITVAENGSFGLEDIDLNEKVAADVNGEVVEMLVDMNAGTLKKKVDGGGLETIEVSLNTSSEWYPYFKAACSVDFGQLSYSPTETGYKALCSNNISTPTIKNSSTGFDVITYTGNGSVRNITDLNFNISAGGLVWIKNRDTTDEHKLIDTVRGATKELSSDTAAVESTDANGLTAFLSNGFSLGTGAAGYNDNAEKFVAWCFRMGVNFGFDIQTYTGTGVAHAENHNLGGVPELMIFKNLSQADNWRAYHHHALNKTDPETDFGVLDTDAVWADHNTIWNDTAPTSSQFTVGTAHNVNANTENYISYLWRSITGFSKVFSYTGNGNANGPFVYCGFRPRYVMIKKANAVGHWVLLDAERSSYNPAVESVYADLTNAEIANTYYTDILSNGFKLRGTHADFNTNAGLYVGIAIAEQPGKYSNSR